jgi:predicted restriction endonuclease
MPADAQGLYRYVVRRCPNISSQLTGWFGISDAPLGDTDADESPDLTPAGADERERITRGIRLRRGQPAFRNSLLDRHEGRCVVTGCGVLGVLEAAHIRPYRGPRDNHPSNGLLLRSDLHTLFDLNRIGIDPDKLTIALHESLVASEYAHLNQKPLQVTHKSAPDKRALRLRWKEFLAAETPKKN